ncbi:hypothetical protein [Aureibacter tunicatorum]|uniref:Uncharacterized protein n=1 Tax=Aureibacter tunicatorum TaxID=866807 RepID=A0AAE3XJ71_9BACT|nr:hypothetical protein [Aureibacter tunicatorum]MDR6237380.1 hypothetical protein [Aureibacter tunicatorum]BDD06370.1 hypothetical protein AUTU_38530 [Aureibacter tunicatorum]
MKKYIYALFIAAGLFACKNEDLEKGADNNHQTETSNPEAITYKLSVAGELLRNESSFSRAKKIMNDEKTFFGIQVYQMDTNNTNSEKYAWGLFDNVDSMQIELIPNKKYKFDVVSYKKGTGGGLYNFKESEIDSISIYLGDPFYFKKISNGFNYSLTSKLDVFSNYISYFDKNNRSYTSSYPEIEAYVGRVYVIPDESSENNNINIVLNKAAYGSRLVVQNLNDGQIKIRFQDKTMTFDQDTTTAMKIISRDLSYIANASINNDSTYLNKTIKNYISITKIHDSGIEESLYSGNLEFNRNKITTYTLTAPSSNGESGQGGFSFTFEETPMEEIDGGEIFDIPQNNPN